MVGLPLAFDGFVFDLGVGNGLAGGQHFQRFTSPGALFKSLGLDGGGLDADVLDELALDLDGLGFLDLVLADLGADGHPLDGEAGLAGLVLDDVLAGHGLHGLGDHGNGAEGLVGEDLGDGVGGSGDDPGLGAMLELLLVPGLVLAGDALARFLNHVGVGRVAGLGHDALFGGLEVSGIFVVEVAAKAAGPGLEQLRGGNFDTFAVEEDKGVLVAEEDVVDVVDVPHDFHDDASLGVGDFLDLVVVDLDLFGAAFEVHLDHDFGGLTLHAQFNLTGEDLDNLFLGTLSQDGDGELVGAVLEEQVPAVVQLVVVGHVVEGGDVLGFDAARGGDLVAGVLLQQGVAHIVPHGHGENVPEGHGDADVFDAVLAASDFGDDLGFFAGPLDLSGELQSGLGGVARFFFPHLSEEDVLDDVSGLVEHTRTGDVLRELDGSLDFVDGSGLVAGEFANVGQLAALLFHLLATLEFGGPLDGFLLLLGLDHGAFQVDPFLLAVFETVLDFASQDEVQSFFNQLVGGPATSKSKKMEFSSNQGLYKMSTYRLLTRGTSALETNLTS